MADKSFGVKELNLISASGTPTITSPNSVNINATNVAISTDITVGGMVSLGAGTSISSPGTNVLTFGTNSTEKVRIDSSGNFGIGTDNPNRLLHLKQSYGGGMLTIERTDSSSSALVIAADSGEIALFARDSDTGSTAVPFVIKQGGSAEALRIDSDGKIGLDGMTNPVAKLHIGTEDDAALTAQTVFVEGAKTGYANYTGLPQNQLCLYDNTASTAGSGGAISFGANCGGSQQTWIAAIESQRDSGTNDASNYAGSIVFWTRPAQSTPTEKLRITSAGDVQIADGNLVVASGHGIDFSATANGTTSSSELFDDYEEGAWTPSITLGGGSTGMTYSRQEGHYTKIGRQVIAQFRITLTAKGSSTGQLRINGLPFTSADTFSSTGIDGQVHIAHDNGFNAGNVSDGAVSGYVEGGTSYFLLTRRDTNASLDTMTNTFIDNDLSISGTVIFYA